MFLPRPHDLQRTAGQQILSIWDVLLDKCGQLGKTLSVIDEDYGFQGPTTASFLLERGHEVDLITSQETIGNFLSTHAHCNTLSWKVTSTHDLSASDMGIRSI